MSHRLLAIVRRYSVPAACILAGLLLAAILFYLTPLHDVTIIEPAIKKTSPEAIHRAISEHPEKYLMIDIRSEEFYALEYPSQSVHIPLNVLAGEVNALPRDKSIVIFCESNFSASAAYHVLKNNGFLDVQIVDGGRTAWKEAGLPLVETSKARQDIGNEIINLKTKLRFTK
ncbi:MAG: rhodanese-like domain-containing protein [Candidatus Sungbacteria bacterium]|nr:rhodanese-like domain-containing protein [Candidatus Sungbacteria bacterium]